MYIRYIYKLCNLHLGCGNHTEAGFTLKLHAELLEWGDRMLPSNATYPGQFEWQRKEMLYLKIIDEFNQGKVSSILLKDCVELNCMFILT